MALLLLLEVVDIVSIMYCFDLNLYREIIVVIS